MNRERHLIQDGAPILKALEMLNELSADLKMVLFVVNDANQLMGSLTDGDVRRGLLSGLDVKDPVGRIMNPNCRFLIKNGYSYTDIEAIRSNKIALIPILDLDRKILRIIDLHEKRSMLPLDAVIMAGGRGERLKPLTDKTPKPMLPVGNKPIIEYNVDNLVNYGIEHITISVRYLGDQIVDHFGDGASRQIAMDYIHEDEPLGTFGAIALRNTFHHDTILVMNSDLLTNINFEDFYKHFDTEDADFSVACIPYKVKVPYAVMETDGHKVKSLKEKPTYTYYSNAGIYLLKRNLLDLLKKGEHFNTPDFIELLIEKGYKVTSYPLLSYWLDIGQPEDYQKAQEDVSQIKF